jgi:pimeloyl-ACP methyl ester carboxylesterase
VTARTVNAGGLELAVLEEGDGPLVLLLHGFPDTAESWAPTLAALAGAGYRAAAPYLRGYHPSAIPADGDYSPEALGRDVTGLIAALGEESAIVVGHDWGASAAFSAAITEPERVRFLVTVAIPHPASLRPTPLLIWRARHFLKFKRRGAEDEVRAEDFAYIDELYRRWSPAWDFGPEETAAVKRAFSQPGSLEAALGYYRAVGARPPPSHRGKVTMPSVAFAGATDGGVKPAAFERARRLYTDRYEIVTLPGGHFLHREHPEPFHRELLSRLPAPGAVRD